MDCGTYGSGKPRVDVNASTATRRGDSLMTPGCIVNRTEESEKAPDGGAFAEILAQTESRPSP